MTGLHHQIKQKAMNGNLRLDELKPNSREIALRLIESGELIKSKNGYVWHSVEDGK